MSDEMRIDPGLLHHISPSSFDQFSRCPAQWAYVRLEGLKIPPGIAAHVGSGLHVAAETNMRQKIVTGLDLPADDLADAAVTGYRARVEKEGVFFSVDERPAASRLLEAGIDRAAAFGRTFAEVAPGYRPAAVEQRITYQDPGLPIPWMGVLDMRSADNRLVDWKTAGRRWPSGREARETQATVYWRLFCAETGAPPEEIAFEVFVGGKGGVDHDRRPTTRGEEDWEALQHGARTMVRMVGAGIFPPAVSGSWWCSPKWCGLWWICKHIPERLRRLPNV
jgi:hypothetical protein